MRPHCWAVLLRSAGDAGPFPVRCPWPWLAQLLLVWGMEAQAAVNVPAVGTVPPSQSAGRHCPQL